METVRKRKSSASLNETRGSCANSRFVMKIPSYIDMHLQDSDCAPDAHFARFQDFPRRGGEEEEISQK